MPASYGVLNNQRSLTALDSGSTLMGCLGRDKFFTAGAVNANRKSADPC